MMVKMQRDINAEITDRSMCIIGTLTRFDEIQTLAQSYSEQGYAVRYPYPSTKNHKELIEECFDAIRKADSVVVVPHKDGTIGTGSLYEALYAKSLNKLVTIWFD